MMTHREASSEKDVLHEFAMTYQHPDVDQLDDYTRRFPSYADSLTLLAIEFALDALTPEAHAAEEVCIPDATIDAMLSRVMSRFQNLLYEVRSREPAVASKLDPQQGAAHFENLLAQHTPEQMKGLCRALEVSPLFLKRVRDREIEAATIPKQFVVLFARAINGVESEAAAFFSGRPRIAAHVRFKADSTPIAGRQMTFEDAVRKSALSPDQQARLLSLMQDIS